MLIVCFIVDMTWPNTSTVIYSEFANITETTDSDTETESDTAHLLCGEGSLSPPASDPPQDMALQWLDCICHKMANGKDLLHRYVSKPYDGVQYYDSSIHTGGANRYRKFQNTYSIARSKNTSDICTNYQDVTVLVGFLSRRYKHSSYYVQFGCMQYNVSSLGYQFQHHYCIDPDTTASLYSTHIISPVTFLNNISPTEAEDYNLLSTVPGLDFVVIESQRFNEKHLLEYAMLAVHMISPNGFVIITGCRPVLPMPFVEQYQICDLSLMKVGIVQYSAV